MQNNVRLGIGERIAIAGVVGGLAGTLAAMALPLAYPDTQIWIWRLILWASCFVLIGSILFLLYDVFLRHRVVGKLNMWAPWILIIGGPIIGLLWLYLSKTGAIEWDFERTGYPIRLEWQIARAGEPARFFVPGFIFTGKNGPTPIYQIEASVTIDHNKKVIPLYIAASGQWVQFENSNGIPAGARFEIGCQMRDDTLHCEGFPSRISPEQFLIDVGGFTFTFAHDGEPPQNWHFTSAQLRQQFEKQTREVEEQSKRDPTVTKRDSSMAPSKPETPPGGVGGKGGDAKVGGNGIAVAGPGGSAGKYGAGGVGGNAEVSGDGIAAGGAGGSAGDDGIWRAPAKSGYETCQRKMGLPVDPVLRQYGRGGATPGYEPKLQIIEQLRAAYFREHAKKTESIFENINAVPLDYLNDALAAKKEIWRVRVVDDEYEFFIPRD